MATKKTKTKQKYNYLRGAKVPFIGASQAKTASKKAKKKFNLTGRHGKI